LRTIRLGLRLLWAATITLGGVFALAQSPTVQAPQQPPKEDPVKGTVIEPESTVQAGPHVSKSASACQAKVPSSATEGSAGQPFTAPSAYVPLSSQCKFELFLRQTYSPYTFASAAYEATWAQMWAQWPQYGGGMQGWGKRFGATLADTESRRFIQSFLLSTVLHQDPRYFPSRKRRLVARAWYAATRVVVTKGDVGQNEFNTSELLGTLATSSLQNAYYPEHYRTLGGTVSRFSGALSSDATSDLLHEFAPDLKRIFRKHAPEKVKKIEQKIPLPPDDKP
jgi:hypothetical protein